MDCKVSCHRQDCQVNGLAGSLLNRDIRPNAFHGLVANARNIVEVVHRLEATVCLTIGDNVRRPLGTDTRNGLQVRLSRRIQIDQTGAFSSGDIAELAVVLATTEMFSSLLAT